MLRRENQRKDLRTQAQSQQDPIQQILSARASLVSFACSRVGDAHLAQDLFQLSVLRAIERRSSLKRRESAVTWFRSILHHAIVDHLRKHAVETRGRNAFRQALIHSGHGTVPPFEVVSDNPCTCATALLPILRPRDAELIRRVDLNGELSKTVAEDLASTPNNVRVRLHRARQTLRAQVARVCGLCCEHSRRNCTCDASSIPTSKQ